MKTFQYFKEPSPSFFFIDICSKTSSTKSNGVLQAFFDSINTTDIPLPNPTSFFHFHGSDESNGTEKNDLDARFILSDAVNEFVYSSQSEDSMIRLGIALHIYADTFAHEGYSSPFGHMFQGGRPDAILYSENHSCPNKKFRYRTRAFVHRAHGVV